MEISNNSKKYLVILDAGHGINPATNGKRTPIFPDGSFMRENEFNRNVVRKIDILLERYEDIDVVFATTEKRDISLPERIGRINQLYDKVKGLYDKIILISVHANAMYDYWNGVGYGTATFYYPTNMVDKKLAEVIQRNLIAKTKLKPHRDGVVAENFQIIRECKMTACLCECAFMDNLKEAKLLLTEEFRQVCADGITNGILEYLKVGTEVNYKKYRNMTELKGEPVKINNKEVNQNNRTIQEPNCLSGTFFWYSDAKRTITYPTSILVRNGKIIRDVANHYYNFNCPQNVLIVYNDGKVEMKKIFFAHQELDIKNIKIAVGGVGLRDTTNPNFKYDPKSEGFKKGINNKGEIEDQSGVLRKTDKAVIGYNIKNNKLYLLAVENITHGDLIKTISDNSTGEAYDIALSLDGGGSVMMNNSNSMVFYGDGRLIDNIIYFDM